jgi:universal stress protein E
MAWKKLLIAVSRTDTLEQPAVQRALALAGEDGAEVELFRCVYDANVEGYPWTPREEDYFDARDSLVQREAVALRSLVETLQQLRYSATATAVWDYPVYQSIVRRAVATRADIIVSESLRTPRRRGRRLASADWHLVSGSPAPLLLVKSSGTESYRHVAAAVDPFHAHDKPAALDEAILARAREMARLFNARLSAVHCFVPLGEIIGPGSEIELPSMQDEIGWEETRRVVVRDLLLEQGIDPESARLLPGTPGEALPRFVEDERVDLLVMGALARGRTADLIVGTTAAEVLDAADCDLLIVKPADFFDAVAKHIRMEPATRRFSTGS